MTSNFISNSFESTKHLLCSLLLVCATRDLVSCSNQTMDQLVHLLAVADCPDYVIGERVYITVFTDPHRPMLQFIWDSVEAGGETVYFTAKPLFESNVIDDRFSNHTHHTNHTFPPARPVQVDTSLAFLSVTVGRAHWLFAASQLSGWTYFLLWILSMYPQIIFNQRRQSVAGLNFDYLAFSLLGYAAYALFNCSLYFVPYFRNAYLTEYPHSHVPVQLNDVFFSIHGVVASLIVVLQCMFFERANQQISAVGVAVICAVLCMSGALFVALSFGIVRPLQFSYFFSYVKVVLTFAKYIPQAVFNFRRKSTSGWCIHNILLDINGGCLSILQMLLLTINYRDVRFLNNNLAKLGIGAVSIAFDLIFLAQHYCLYGDGEPLLLDGLLQDDFEQPIKSGEGKDRLLACDSIDRKLQYGATTSSNKSVDSKIYQV